MRAARAGISAIGVALVVGGLAAASRQRLISGDSAIQVALAIAVVAIAAVCGWVLGPAHRGGGLLVQLGGVLTGAGVLRHLDVDVPVRVMTGASWLVAPATLLGACLLCVPRDRISGGRERTAVLLWVTAAAGIAVSWTGGRIGPGSMTRFASDTRVPTWSRLLLGVHLALLVAGIVGVLVQERRAASSGISRRTEIVAVAVWGTITAVSEVLHLLPVHMIFEFDDGHAGYRNWAATFTINLPLAATVGLVVSLTYVELIRPKLLRTPSGDLALDEDTLEVVEEQLAVWTGDPTIRVGYATADSAWSDCEGRPFVPSRSDDRSITTLTRRGLPVALLEHDSSLDAQPGAVEIAANITALALEVEAATVEATSRVGAARRVSARLLVAEDDAREVLTAELDRGPVADLRTLAATVRSSAELAGVADQIRSITATVRTISHGVFPPDLENGGLAAVLPDAGALPNRRLPRPVEITVYLLVRDIPDVRVMDRGTFVEVQLSEPLRDLHVIDRVHILGGSIDGSRIDLPIGSV